MRRKGGPEVLPVVEARDEARGIRSLFVHPSPIGDWKGCSPGQFLMVWVPGVDEVPMSVSYLGGKPFNLGFTVQDIGEATHAICSLEEGEPIGIRGPYGKGFRFPRDMADITVIGVSGGVGAASTVLAMERAKVLNARTINLVGARDKDTLLFRGRWERTSDEVLYATDDGSFGRKGFVTELLEGILDHLDDASRPMNTVLACGPEPMLERTREIMRGSRVPCQFSLERFMKCGIGLCDSCSLSGRRVCMDGPVFGLDEVVNMEEFGRTHRDRTGRKVPIKECFI